MARKYLIQFIVRTTFKSWHDLKDVLKVPLLTICLIAGVFQRLFAQKSYPHKLKSTATAVKYSLYGTTIPIVVGGAIFSAAIVADAEEPDLFLGGIKVRSLGAVREDRIRTRLCRTLGAIYLWSTIHDFRSLNESVERYNQKHSDVILSIGPTYDAREKAPGIVACVRF